MKKSNWLLCFLGFIGLIITGIDSCHPVSYMNKGKKYFKAKNYNEAIAISKKRIYGQEGMIQNANFTSDYVMILLKITSRRFLGTVKPQSRDMPMRNII